MVPQIQLQAESTDQFMPHCHHIYLLLVASPIGEKSHLSTSKMEKQKKKKILHRNRESKSDREFQEGGWFNHWIAQCSTKLKDPSLNEANMDIKNRIFSKSTMRKDGNTWINCRYCIKTIKRQRNREEANFCCRWRRPGRRRWEGRRRESRRRSPLRVRSGVAVFFLSFFFFLSFSPGPVIRSAAWSWMPEMAETSVQN